MVQALRVLRGGLRAAPGLGYTGAVSMKWQASLKVCYL